MELQEQNFEKKKKQTTDAFIPHNGFFSIHFSDTAAIWAYAKSTVASKYPDIFFFFFKLSFPFWFYAVFLNMVLFFFVTCYPGFLVSFAVSVICWPLFYFVPSTFVISSLAASAVIISCFLKKKKNQLSAVFFTIFISIWRK